MSDAPETARVWRARPQVYYRALADGGMLFDADGRCVHHLNATAACIWEACQDGAVLAHITAAVCNRFDVVPDQAEGDIRQVLDQFRQAGLLQA